MAGFPKPGDTLEAAIWLTGKESKAQMAALREIVEENAFGEAEEIHNIVLGPRRMAKKRPGEARVPTVPDHIKGPDVRLLVIEADVVALAPKFTESINNFVLDLDKQDLARLRKITREARAKQAPHSPPLSDAACDDIIQRLGPDVAAKTVKAALDG